MKHSYRKKSRNEDPPQCQFVRDDGWKCLRIIEDGNHAYCKAHRTPKKAAKPEPESERIANCRAGIYTAIRKSLVAIGFTETMNAVGDALKTISNEFIQNQYKFME